MLRPLLAAALLLSCMITLDAQDTLIHVYGRVKEFNTQKPIPGALVLAYDPNDAEYRMTVLSDSLGRYQLGITDERSYRLVYGMVGRYSKSVVIEAVGPTKEQWLGGYGLNIDIVLLPELEGFDMSFGNEPFGYARFNSKTEYFEWDVEYSEAMLERHSSLMDAYKARMGISE